MERVEHVSAGAGLPKETVEFFEGDELRVRVFLDKYALRDLDGRVVDCATW